jgi:PAS domain S-box-containing protein
VKQELVERQRAEGALRESEKKYRTILDNIEEGYFEVDPKGNLTFFNDSLSRITGYSRDEMMGMNNRQYMDEENAKKVFQAFNRVYSTGKPVRGFEWEIIRKDDTRGFVETSVSLVKNSEGEPIGFRGIAHDVTERKWVEEELRKHRDHLEELVEERAAELTKANEQLQREITERKRVEERLTAVHTLGQKLVLSRDAVEIARSVVDVTWRVLRLPACSLWLVDEERRMLARRAQTAGLEATETPSLPLDSERGIIVSVVRSGEPIYLPDVSQDPRYVDGGFQSCSELCVPLRVGDRVTGALNAESKKLDDFGPDDRQILEALANSAAIAIENARLFQEIQRRAEEMAALREVNLATLSTLERDQVFEIMLDQLGVVIDYDTAAIKVITPDGKDKMIAGRGPIIHDQAMWDGFDEKDSDLVQEMKETGQPVVVHDTHTDERYRRAGNWEAFHSWVGAPLFVRGDMIGYLAVEKTLPGFYDENAVQLLGDFARSAAIALENARLYEDIRRERDYSQTLIATTNALVVGLDLEGRITLFNDSCVEITGYRREEVLGRDWFTTLLPERERLPARQAFRELVEQGLSRQYEDPILTRDGREQVIAWSGTVICDAEGRLASVLTIGQDITERKRAEGQLQRYAAELEQANEELKRLTYLASHNLRAPLVNLKGFAVELRAALAVIGYAVITALPHLDEKQRQTVTTALQEDVPEALGFIDSSVTRLDRLTKALLKLSRLGRRKLKLEPIDMNALAQATLETLAHQIEEHQVKVAVGSLPEVVADRISMEQILGNLLGNAVKYLDPGRPGEIEITGERDPSTGTSRAESRGSGRDPSTGTSRAESRGSGHEHHETIFRVRDNGRGIAGEDMDKVFAPFRRAGKQDVPGEGMGLPYVQTLLRRHGGRLWCESEPGKGSTFYFTIPASADVKKPGFSDPEELFAS